MRVLTVLLPLIAAGRAWAGTDAAPEAAITWEALSIQIGSALIYTLKILAIALPFQLLFPGRKRTQKKFLSYEFFVDLLYWLHAPLLFALGLNSLIALCANAVYGNLPDVPWFPALRTLPEIAQIGIAVWLYDFVVYWRHRAEHTFRPLWAFHAVHHSAEQVDVMTTNRIHPGELVAGVVLNELITVMGISLPAATTAFAIYLGYNYFIHADVRIRFSGPLKYLFVTPFMHHWHHATDREAAGKNLGVVFAWNDWLFGTAHHPAQWPEHYGLGAPPAEQVGQSYIRTLLYPLQYAWAQASTLLRR